MYVDDLYRQQIADSLNVDKSMVSRTVTLLKLVLCLNVDTPNHIQLATDSKLTDVDNLLIIDIVSQEFTSVRYNASPEEHGTEVSLSTMIM